MIEYILLGFVVFVYITLTYLGFVFYERIKQKLILIHNSKLESTGKKTINKAINFSISNIRIGYLLGGFIVILVGINILPTILNKVKWDTNVANVTGVAGTVLNIVPLFFALGIMAAGISVVIGGLRRGGLV